MTSLLDRIIFIIVWVLIEIGILFFKHT